MSTTIYGTKPSKAVGKEFPGSPQNWAAIHDLICELCADIFDRDTLIAMWREPYMGRTDQKICDEIANRFEQWIREHPLGYCPDHGRCISTESLQSFVTFLRHCGGFHVM